MDLWLERAWFIQEAATKQPPPSPPPPVATTTKKTCPRLKIMSWIQIHESEKQKGR